MTGLIAGRPLTGAQKCAVLCMTLEPSRAARILQELSHEEV